MTKKKTAHASQSFAQMVSQAQINALKPFVEQQVAIQGRMIMQKLAQVMLEHISNLQTRHLALENLLVEKTDITKEEIALKITEQEDKAFGYELVDDCAKENDLVRISVASKDADDAEASFGEPEKIRINALSKKVDGSVQTLEQLENGIIGMKIGETKEIRLEADADSPKATLMKVEVIRLSRKIEKGV